MAEPSYLPLQCPATQAGVQLARTERRMVGCVRTMSDMPMLWISGAAGAA